MLLIPSTIDVFYAKHPAIAFPLQTVLLVIAITYSISFIGGWWSLAKRFKTGKPMPAGSFLVSGSLRYIAGYSNLIRAASDADGVYLRFWPRLAHAPLFIPWDAIRLKKPWGLIFKSQTMLLGSNPAIPFTVPQRKVERLTKNRVDQASANGNWPRLVS